MKKKLLIAILLIFGILLLILIYVMLVVEPINVSFEMVLHQTGGQSFSEVYNWDKLKTEAYRGSAEMLGDVEGYFSWTETLTSYYGETGDLEFLIRSFLCEFSSASIGTKSGELVLLLEETYWPGTEGENAIWKIVSGTDDFAELQGIGTAVGYPSYQFEGTIHFP